MFVTLYPIPCKSCEREGTVCFRRSCCTNSFDTEAPLLGLDWSITNGTVYLKFTINEKIFILESARLPLNLHDCPSFAERSDYCVTLDSSILMFHWVRPFTLFWLSDVLSFQYFVFRCFVSLPYRGYVMKVATQ